MSDEAERGREKAEEARVEAEKGRDTAERAAEGRVENEVDRVEAEQGAASGRRVAEGKRVTAEDGRVEAESDRVLAEKSRNNWWHRNQSGVVGLLCGVCVALVVLCGILVNGQGNQTDKARAESFRNCVRANINSAVVRLSAATPRPGQSPAQEARGKQIANALYPIVDCRRQQGSGQTSALSDTQTSKYIKIVAGGRFPVVSDGKVVDSRATLLEGVTTKDLTGE